MYPKAAMNDVDRVRAYYRAILPYYDDALEDRGDLRFWSAIARRWGSRRILELGCGTGRVTKVLSRDGPVTAVDLLTEMLRLALRRAPRARAVAADFRRLAFTSPFDLVVLADDPMSHLTSDEDRTRVVESMSQHLMPGGRVVLEGLYLPSREPRHVRAREILRQGQRMFAVEEHWKPVGEDSLWEATYRYLKGSSIVEATTVLRSWTLDEVDRFRNAGLVIETLLGDFDERPFCDSSPRLVIIARRERHRLS